MTNDLDFFISITFVLISVSLSIFYFVINCPESLKYLLSKNKIEEFWYTYEKTIKKFNEVSEKEEY